MRKVLKSFISTHTHTHEMSVARKKERTKEKKMKLSKYQCVEWKQLQFVSEANRSWCRWLSSFNAKCFMKKWRYSNASMFNQLESSWALHWFTMISIIWLLSWCARARSLDSRLIFCLPPRKRSNGRNFRNLLMKINERCVQLMIYNQITIDQWKSKFKSKHENEHHLERTGHEF